MVDIKLNTKEIDKKFYKKVKEEEKLRKEFRKKFIVDNDFAEEDISRAKKFLLQRGFEFDQINQLFK